MTNVKVGVVGAGYWGPKLVRIFRDLPAAELVAVADINRGRLAEIECRHPDVPITQDYDELLRVADAVVIATPVASHFHLAEKALSTGKHVLVEKPLCATVAQARTLVDLAEKSGLTLMVGHTYVYNPAVEAIREIIASNALGRIFYLNATRANLGLLQPDINVMWDLAPHDISMLCHMLGAAPLRVSTHGATYVNTSRNLHEVIYLNLFFPDNVLANLRLSWLDPVKQRHLTIVGSNKMLVYDDIAEDKVTIFDKGVNVPPYSVTEAEFHASYRHGGSTVYPLEWREPLQSECAHFVDCILNQESPRTSGRDGTRVLQVLEAAQRSLERGGVELGIEYA